MKYFLIIAALLITYALFPSGNPKIPMVNCTRITHNWVNGPFVILAQSEMNGEDYFYEPQYMHVSVLQCSDCGALRLYDNYKRADKNFFKQDTSWRWNDSITN